MCEACQEKLLQPAIMAAQLSAIRRILIDTTGETTVERIAAVMYPQMLLVDGQPQVDIDGQLHDLDG